MKECSHGVLWRGILEKDIAHVQLLLPISLAVDVEGQYLDSAYWRRRLYQILRQDHLSKSNLQCVDALLAVLDQFDMARL
jgi:capsule polysaccharide export protein KpsC/LpsZ